MAKHASSSFSSFSSVLNMGGGKVSNDTSSSHTGAVSGKIGFEKGKSPNKTSIIYLLVFKNSYVHYVIFIRRDV